MGGLTVLAVAFNTYIRFCIMVIKVPFALGDFGFLLRTDRLLQVKQTETPVLK